MEVETVAIHARELIPNCYGTSLKQTVIMEKRSIKKLSKKEQESILGGARRRVRRVGVAMRRRRSSG